MSGKSNRQFVEFYEIDYEGLRNHAFPELIRTILDTINRKVAEHESLNDVMDFLFESTIGICSCNRITLCFFEEEGQRTVIKWSRTDENASSRELVGIEADTHFTTLRSVLGRGRVRLIHDLPAFAELNPGSEFTRLFVGEGYRSSMTAPLIAEERTVGVLIRHALIPHAFTEEHVYQHLATAERLSQAVANTTRLEELRRLNASYMEMLGFVSHEMKSPVSSVAMTSDLLTDGYFGDLEPAQQEKVQGIRRKMEYLLGLLREYLDLARLEGGQLTLNVRVGLDLVADVIQPSLEVVEAQIEERGMQLDWQPPDDPLIVYGDADLLKIVVINLLSNAAKYGNQGGRIELSMELTDGVLRLSVFNEGPGWPASEQPRLFKKFTRLQTQELQQRKGTGVGLYTCWRIVRLHGGHIHAESEHGKWARFTCEIPQALAPPTDELRDAGTPVEQPS